METITLTLNKAAIRKETLNGVSYTVVPCIGITEGVHNGSGGALYYPAEELEKFPAAWNSKPVTIYHPTGGTANTPSEIEARAVGMMMNTWWEAAKDDKSVGKLHMEAWLDETKLNAVDPRVGEAIEKNTTLEISTGLFTENEVAAGDFKGKQYTAIARNYRPDHLAILPDMKGACSVEDGAGFLRLNSAGQPVPRTLLLNAAEAVQSRFVAERLSFDTIHKMVANAIRATYDKNGKDSYYPWVEDLFRDKVVFNGKKGTLLQQEYNITNGLVNLVGTPVEVVRVIEYQKTGTPPVGNAQKTEKAKMDKTQIVDALIANKKFAEADREFLNGLTDERLTAIHNMSVPPKPTAEEEAAAAKKKKDEEAAKNAATPTPITIDQLPAEMRAVYNHGAQALANERAGLIRTITANTANEFKPEQLAAMDLPMLQGLAKIAAAGSPAPRYDGQGGPPPTQNAEPEAPLVAPTMNWDK